MDTGRRGEPLKVVLQRRAQELLAALRRRKAAPRLCETAHHVCTAERCGATLERVDAAENTPIYLCPIGFKAHVCGQFCSRGTRTDGTIVCTLTGRVILNQVMVAEVPEGVQAGDLQIHRFDKATRGQRVVRVSNAAAAAAAPQRSAPRRGWGRGTTTAPRTNNKGAVRKKRKRDAERALNNRMKRHVPVWLLNTQECLRTATRLVVRLLYGPDRQAMTRSFLQSRQSIARASVRTLMANQLQRQGMFNASHAFHKCLSVVCKGLTFSAPGHVVRKVAPEFARRVVQVWVALHKSHASLAVVGQRNSQTILSDAMFQQVVVLLLFMWSNGIVTSAAVDGRSTWAHTLAMAPPQFLLEPQTVLQHHLPPLTVVPMFMHMFDTSTSILTIRKSLSDMCAVLAPRDLLVATSYM